MLDNSIELYSEDLQATEQEIICVLCDGSHGYNYLCQMSGRDE